MQKSGQLPFHIPNLNETSAERPIQYDLGQNQWPLFKMKKIQGMRQNIPRLASPHALTRREVISAHERAQQLRRTFQLRLLTELEEDTDVLLLIRVLEVHLVLNPAKKRLISQLVRSQIGGKHKKCLKRDGDFSACLQGEVVNLALHRHNPAIQNLGWR